MKQCTMCMKEFKWNGDSICPEISDLQVCSIECSDDFVREYKNRFSYEIKEWIYVGNEMPNEGEYVLVKSGEDSPVGISRFIDGEWDTGSGYKRPVFSKTERYLTSASVVYWMQIP